MKSVWKLIFVGILLAATAVLGTSPVAAQQGSSFADAITQAPVGQWTAIALERRTDGGLTWASGWGDSLEWASHYALEACGCGCGVITWSRPGQCVALAVGRDNSYGGATGPIRSITEGEAIRTCAQHGGDGCRVVISQCH